MSTVHIPLCLADNEDAYNYVSDLKYLIQLKIWLSKFLKLICVTGL